MATAPATRRAFARQGGGASFEPVTGSAVIDFGAYPGSNEASVAVIGQTAIGAGASVEAWLAAVASGTHTVSDASYAALFIALTCAAPTAGNGFVISARSLYTFSGSFAVRWVWSN